MKSVVPNFDGLDQAFELDSKSKDGITTYMRLNVIGSLNSSGVALGKEMVAFFRNLDEEKITNAIEAYTKETDKLINTTTEVESFLAQVQCGRNLIAALSNSASIDSRFSILSGRLRSRREMRKDSAPNQFGNFLRSIVQRIEDEISFLNNFISANLDISRKNQNTVQDVIDETQQQLLLRIQYLGLIEEKPLEPPPNEKGEIRAPEYNIFANPYWDEPHAKIEGEVHFKFGATNISKILN